MLGAVGALPDICTELEISYFLLRRLLGVRTEGDKRGAKVGREAVVTIWRGGGGASGGSGWGGWRLTKACTDVEKRYIVIVCSLS